MNKHKTREYFKYQLKIVNKYGSLKNKYKIIPLVIFGGLQFIQNIYKAASTEILNDIIVL